jgi:hypothetical protein
MENEAQEPLIEDEELTLLSKVLVEKEDDDRMNDGETTTLAQRQKENQEKL